jgi:glyoxylase I family protein
MSILFRPHHVSLTVGDMEASIAFYRSFGFDTLHTYSSNDGSRRISHLRLGLFTLELFQFPFRQAERSLSNRDIHPVGIRHFALGVDSITEAYKVVASFGYECEGIANGLSGLKYFFVRDPDGIWFEIVQDDRK